MKQLRGNKDAEFLKELRETDSKLYKQLIKVKALVEDAKKSLPKDHQFMETISRGSPYQVHDLPQYQEMEDDLGVHTAKSLTVYYQGLVQRIQMARHHMAIREPRGALTVAKESTLIRARRDLIEAFPSINFDVEIDKSVRLELKTSYYGDNFVHLKLSWCHAVFDKGISVVKAGDGIRFITDAKERVNSRLNNQGIQAFECKALRVERR